MCVCAFATCAGYSVISDVIRQELGTTASHSTTSHSTTSHSAHSHSTASHSTASHSNASTAELLQPVPSPRLSRPRPVQRHDRKAVSTLRNSPSPTGSFDSVAGKLDADKGVWLTRDVSRRRGVVEKHREAGKRPIVIIPSAEPSGHLSSSTTRYPPSLHPHLPLTHLHAPQPHSPPPPPSTPPQHRLLRSPLHHSTPHAATRSRVFQPHTPYTDTNPRDQQRVSICYMHMCL